MNNPKLFDAVWKELDDAPFVSTEVTLRDLFAAFALAGILVADEQATSRSTPLDTAGAAYIFADAMLAQRDQKPE